MELRSAELSTAELSMVELLTGESLMAESWKWGPPAGRLTTAMSPSLPVFVPRRGSYSIRPFPVHQVHRGEIGHM